MDVEAKMIRMYNEVHGKVERKFRLRVIYNDCSEPLGVSFVKNGQECAYYSKADLLFDWLTKDMQE